MFYLYVGMFVGVVGGVIGNIMVLMIFGLGEKCWLCCVNMWICMYFKGYDCYGFSKVVWDDFNFEEGLLGVLDEKC